jgi:hypothetical protein
MSTKAIGHDAVTSGNDAVADFLKRLPSLRSKKTPVAKPWQKAFAAMPDDPLCTEAARLGAEWRDAMNKKSHG